MSTRSGFMFFTPLKVSNKIEFINTAHVILYKPHSTKEESRAILFEFINLVRFNKSIVIDLPDYFISLLILKMNQLNDVIPSRTLTSIITDFSEMLCVRKRHT
jgi:hypothetical protein